MDSFTAGQARARCQDHGGLCAASGVQQRQPVIVGQRLPAEPLRLQLGIGLCGKVILPAVERIGGDHGGDGLLVAREAVQQQAREQRQGRRQEQDRQQQPKRAPGAGGGSGAGGMSGGSGTRSAAPPGALQSSC